jgi:hypothetical protein
MKKTINSKSVWEDTPPIYRIIPSNCGPQVSLTKNHMTKILQMRLSSIFERKFLHFPRDTSQVNVSSFTEMSGMCDEQWKVFTASALMWTILFVMYVYWFHKFHPSGSDLM